MPTKRYRVSQVVAFILNSLVCVAVFVSGVYIGKAMQTPRMPKLKDGTAVVIANPSDKHSAAYRSKEKKWFYVTEAKAGELIEEKAVLTLFGK